MCSLFYIIFFHTLRSDKYRLEPVCTKIYILKFKKFASIEVHKELNESTKKNYFKNDKYEENNKDSREALRQ